MRPGHCSECDTWLGIEPNSGSVSSFLDQGESSQQDWVAELVGELLARASSLSEPPSRQSIAALIVAFVERLAGDNNAELARQLNLSRYSIRDCRRGDQLLQFSTLLNICKRLNISLYCLLTDEALLSNPPAVANEVSMPTQQHKGGYRQTNRALLQQALQAELGVVSDPPASMRAVAERLGYDLSFLTSRFPDECQRIKVRYKDYRDRNSQQLHAQLHREVRQVMAQLYEQDIYPSQKRVAALLSRSWFLWLPEGRSTWRATLHELAGGTQDKEEVHSYV
jgi:hypothetical protein